MKKGFTLIELLVAMAVLAMMIAFASMIFKVSIDTYRVSMSTTEIMQKLRAVTGQLDTDFQGLRRDAPILILFEKRANNDPNRYDEIMFFADGDFSSIQVYDAATGELPKTTTTKVAVVRGSTARVFYGQGQKFNAMRNKLQDPWDQEDKNGRKTIRGRILARRQHILTSELTGGQPLYDWPKYNLSAFTTGNNETYEHDRLSLAEWQTEDGAAMDKVIPDSFTHRPELNMGDPGTYHKLLCEGIGSFTIQWAYWDDSAPNIRARFYWFPSDDPYGNNSQSHFTLMGGKDAFGVYFNVPKPDITRAGWYTPGNHNVGYRASQMFPDNFFPAALKFTFTLYDSKGVIKDGMVFSHIVYLGQ